MGIERYVKSLSPPKTEHITDVSVLMSRPWHLPIILAIIGLGWAAHPFAGAALTAWRLSALYRRKKVSDQANAILSAMLHTYLSFNTVDLSWRHVTAILERSRETGVIWDASLYALAEQRTKLQSRHIEGQNLEAVTVKVS